jgi:hypothetical protein
VGRFPGNGPGRVRFTTDTSYNARQELQIAKDIRKGPLENGAKRLLQKKHWELGLDRGDGKERNLSRGFGTAAALLSFVRDEHPQANRGSVPDRYGEPSPKVSLPQKREPTPSADDRRPQRLSPESRPRERVPPSPGPVRTHVRTPVQRHPSPSRRLPPRRRFVFLPGPSARPYSTRRVELRSSTLRVERGSCHPARHSLQLRGIRSGRLAMRIAVTAMI